ncbi:microtubule-associated protein Jupiter isoform X2 [Copidosoma floridanum]|uniref:microtubule-associated protein Jupiter isoform X2 n=1 Tax=Copidosoma floridanum TaxID=29053 RepID=UPI0006C96F53|nr:microtubule-associated protein Jupiter isoform X2 [Copidosoma floridanum]
MTSTGTFQGLSENRNSSKVLKPPGGGSSDIFGAGSETNSPRRVKQHQQSQLGAFFNGGDKPGQQQDTSSSNGSSAPETPRSKPAFRRIKRFRGSSCIPRNPVTGDGVDVKPHASRRMIRRTKEGNPVTGTGYENSAGQQNGTISGSASSAGSEKSSTDSSPSAGLRMKKQRVPPGGFSSGLW